MPRHSYLSLLLLTFACNRDPAEEIKEVPAGDGGAGGQLGASPDDDTGDLPKASSGGGSSSERSTATILNESHPGYRQPECLNCHGSVAPLPHADKTYRAPDCANCHGGNGAPTRDHAVIENTGCANCHSSVNHVPSFTAPTDCVVCHGSK
jgi:hypothetical protein